MRRMRGSAARSEGSESKSVLDSVETLLIALPPAGPGSLMTKGWRRLTRTGLTAFPDRGRVETRIGDYATTENYR
jgi:hypothetical protein